METIKIIAYGTLMSGESNHHFCKNSINIKPCFVKGTLYDTGFGFPALKIIGDNKIKAEIIELPKEDLNKIDILECYPYMYNRCLIKAETKDGIDEGWIYTINILPSDSIIIPSGDWKRR